MISIVHRIQLLALLAAFLFPLSTNAQTPDIFAPGFSEGKTAGEISAQVVEYWDRYYEEKMESGEIQAGKLKGTGYQPWLWQKEFYEMRKNENGEIPYLHRWNEFLKVRSRAMKSTTTVPVANWQSLGPNTIDTLAGRMLCHVFHPTDTLTIWAGSGSGGLWKTVNGGDNWFPVTENIPSHIVSAVTVNPQNPDHLLIGTGTSMGSSITLRPGVGILESFDGGVTWNPNAFTYTLSQSISTVRLIWDHSDTSNVYLAASNGLWVSRDAGQTWANRKGGQATDLVQDYKNPDILYAAILGDGVYKSIDAGDTWTILNNGLPTGAAMHKTSLALCDSFPNVLYVGVTAPSTFALEGFYVSHDAGASFNNLPNAPAYMCQNGSASCIGWFVNRIAVSPADSNLILAGGIQLWRSTDGGGAWQARDYISNGVGLGNAGLAYVDHHDMGFHPANPQTVYVFNDGGVQRSTDGGFLWERICQDLVTAQIYRIASHPQDTNLIIAGFQDHGLQICYLNGGNTHWTRWYVDDGTNVQWDPNNPQVMYGDGLFARHFKSTNGGFNWLSTLQINAGITSTSATFPFRSATIHDPNVSGLLYTSTDAELYRTTNGGSLWQPLAQIPWVSKIEVSPLNSNHIYASAYNGFVNSWTFHHSTDAGFSWTAGTSPGWRVTDVEADPIRFGTVYACRNSAAAGNPHFFKSTNHGQTWNAIGTGLPDIPVTSIALNTYNSDYIYLGTDLGVYVSTDAGLTWDEFNDNLPPIYVQDIEFHPGDTTVRIGTMGRGAWKTKSVPCVFITGAEEAIQAPKLLGELTLFPNPSAGPVQIDFELGAEAPVSLEIYEVGGQLVGRQIHGTLPIGRHQVSVEAINLLGHPLAAGIYYVKFKTGGEGKFMRWTML